MTPFLEQNADSDEAEVEEEEEELGITDAIARAAAQVSSRSRFPQHSADLLITQAIPREGVPVTKGRPKFRMFTQEQMDTGPLQLARGVEVPATINKFLRPYQRQGVEFLYHQFKNDMGGSELSSRRASRPRS